MLKHTLSTPTSPARVVMLGARGFVATNLLRRLAESDVPALGLPSDSLDLTEPGAGDRLAHQLRTDDALVFVSALTPDKGRDIRTMMRNLQMGEQVCLALVAQPCAHVVYVSTDAVYEDAANPVRESSCAVSSSYHGTMHLVRERMLIETLKASRTPLAIVRPSLLFGPGDTHNGYGPNRFVRTAIAEKRIALFGGGEERRDHVYIDDLSRLLELVLRHRSAGILNIATGHSRSFADVARTVASLVGNGVQIAPSPRANPVTHRHFDITATIQAFPEFAFTPLEVALAETLARV
jgi:nucleoside-diphosphate-sugar epimerase